MIIIHDTVIDNAFVLIVRKEQDFTIINLLTAISKYANDLYFNNSNLEDWSHDNIEIEVLFTTKKSESELIIHKKLDFGSLAHLSQFIDEVNPDYFKDFDDNEYFNKSLIYQVTLRLC